ncbi:hypothetical protein [Sulfitobacter dubius]|uniref:hypothetical protein n=1 Tax=Sulfitobacter dubius TaxID=218673 RepID=UPI0029433FCF|nr:hypothetical protein [Sulfitobacter dubius]WOI30069.1 hypothetical protein R1T39_05020 [Sulfitobacter dubius]
MSAPLNRSRPDLTKALEEMMAVEREERLQQDQHATTLARLRAMEGSGPWLHEPPRCVQSRRWPAYLGVILFALLLASLIASIATAASTAIAQIQITPNLALYCGAC